MQNAQWRVWDPGTLRSGRESGAWRAWRRQWRRSRFTGPNRRSLQLSRLDALALFRGSRVAVCQSTHWKYVSAASVIQSVGLEGSQSRR